MEMEKNIKLRPENGLSRDIQQYVNMMSADILNLISAVQSLKAGQDLSSIRSSEINIKAKADVLPVMKSLRPAGKASVSLPIKSIGKQRSFSVVSAMTENTSNDLEIDPPSWASTRPQTVSIVPGRVSDLPETPYGVLPQNTRRRASSAASYEPTPQRSESEMSDS